MFIKILQFDWIGIMLVAFTMFMVVRDRAFSKKIRTEFELTCVLVLYMTLISDHLLYGKVASVDSIKSIALANDIIVRVVVVLMLAHIYFQMNKDKIDKVYIAILWILLSFSAIAEYGFKQSSNTNGIFCVIVSLYYYYFVMQNYKKDGLTKLLLRHDLQFEMEDLHNQIYDVVLVDVDNFKLINDKYGHEKGDEVLRDISSTIVKHLPKKCRAYRFGGDEFVVMSRNLDSSIVEKAFEDINTELLENELRISYGVSRHEPGTWGKDCIEEADKKMYENKKLLKSENIWDDMTGLFNFKGFLDELEEFRKNVARDNHSVCLVAMDIDRLNNINMAYGYAEGNMCITVLARVIKTCLKGREFIGHLGSDEFAVAIECNDDQDVRPLDFIHDINEGLSAAYEFASKDYSLKVNIGRFFIPDNSKLSVDELVNNVLYAKQTDKEDRRKTGLGENDNEYDEQEEVAVRDILDNNKLKYAYQPIVSAKDGEIVAYEALMRSDTEIKISPLKILKYAERSNRLYDIEKYTFFNVLAQIKETNCIKEDRRIFINSIPHTQFTKVDYDLLKSRYKELFSRIVVEITEQREMDDENLSEINQRRVTDGFNLAIDDYGSGYSNTNSLLRYMPQVVKLDRLLITGIDRNAKKQFFVNSIISFARENDMMILAEGVETENELKTVIRLGVDMIQGFYTAKPSFEVLDSIADDIKKIIIDENIKVAGNQRMVYTAASDCELSVVHLAMEDYTKINISTENVYLVGNQEYTADLVIRVKDNVKCNITLTDVSLNSVDEEPCIDIGENSDVVLKVVGENKLYLKGIHVPDTSSLTIKGSGNLSLLVKGHECYAIGADSESAFGNITLKCSGKIYLNVDGERCTAIGGGLVGDNSKISILLGQIVTKIAGEKAIGIGSHKGNVSIEMKSCSFSSDFRVNKGIVIGSFDGDVYSEFDSFSIEIEGSGTEVCCIGSINKSSGTAKFTSGSYKAKLNGQKIYLLGCNEGEMDIEVTHTRIEVMGEGDNVVGFGSVNKLSTFVCNEGYVALVINASNPLGFGIKDEKVRIPDKMYSIKINGEDVAI